MKTWDCVIVGAGPAGLSAAVYMGRFRRSTLVLDSGDGRWSYGQVNDNYLGFPGGVRARRLHALGRAQARALRGDRSRTRRSRRSKPDRTAGTVSTTTAGRRAARTVIWAAGVRDRWPDFPGVRRLVGKHLFWCIVCDGWRTQGRRVVILGEHREGRGHRAPVPHLHPGPDLRRRSRRGSARAAAASSRRRGSRSGAAASGGWRPETTASSGWSSTIGSELRPDYIFSLYGSEPRTELLRGPARRADPQRARAHRREEPHQRADLLRGRRRDRQTRPPGRGGGARRCCGRDVRQPGPVPAVAASVRACAGRRRGVCARRGAAMSLQHPELDALARDLDDLAAQWLCPGDREARDAIQRAADAVSRRARRRRSIPTPIGRWRWRGMALDRARRAVGARPTAPSWQEALRAPLPPRDARRARRRRPLGRHPDVELDSEIPDGHPGEVGDRGRGDRRVRGREGPVAGRDPRAAERAVVGDPRGRRRRSAGRARSRARRSSAPEFLAGRVREAVQLGLMQAALPRPARAARDAAARRSAPGRPGAWSRP